MSQTVKKLLTRGKNLQIEKCLPGFLAVSLNLAQNSVGLQRRMPGGQNRTQHSSNALARPLSMASAASSQPVCQSVV